MSIQMVDSAHTIITTSIHMATTHLQRLLKITTTFRVMVVTIHGTHLMLNMLTMPMAVLRGTHLFISILTKQMTHTYGTTRRSITHTLIVSIGVLTGTYIVILGKIIVKVSHTILMATMIGGA